MNLNAFIGQKTAPTDAEVAAALGAKKKLWDRLLTELTNSFDLLPEWNSYSVKAGWSMRLKLGKRNIVYFTPRAKAFGVSFALGAKAVKEARENELPDSVIQAIDSAPVYAEGTGLRLEIGSVKDIATVKTLVGIKLSN
jgi:hypothetical protein